jgi:hypothetical protein
LELGQGAESPLLIPRAKSKSQQQNRSPENESENNSKDFC